MLTLGSEWPSAEMNNCDGDCALAAFCRRPRVSVAVDHIAYRDPAAVSLAVLQLQARWSSARATLKERTCFPVCSGANRLHMHMI